MERVIISSVFFRVGFHEPRRLRYRCHAESSCKRPLVRPPPSAWAKYYVFVSTFSVSTNNDQENAAESAELGTLAAHLAWFKAQTLERQEKLWKNLGIIKLEREAEILAAWKAEGAAEKK